MVDPLGHFQLNTAEQCDPKHDPSVTLLIHCTLLFARAVLLVAVVVGCFVAVSSLRRWVSVSLRRCGVRVIMCRHMMTLCRSQAPAAAITAAVTCAPQSLCVACAAAATASGSLEPWRPGSDFAREFSHAERSPNYNHELPQKQAGLACRRTRCVSGGCLTGSCWCCAVSAAVPVQPRSTYN